MQGFRILAIRAGIGLCAGMLLVACGGGGTDPSAKIYSFHTPSLGTSTTYAVQVTENSNNEINYQSVRTIPVVNSDGSFQDTFDDSSGPTIINGTPYAGQHLVEARDATGNLLTRNFVTATPTYSCAFSPKEILLPYPLHIGQTWSTNWTSACTNGTSATYILTNGVVQGVESVTVPAGTFEALKITYSLQVASSASSVVLQLNVTMWVSTVDGTQLLLRTLYSYPGAVPSNGYPVQVVRQLTGLK